MTLITDGVLGSEILKFLDSMSRNKCIPLKAALNYDWFSHRAEFVAVISDRPYFSFNRRLSEIFMGLKVAHTFVNIEKSILNVGPLIVPFASPCFNCYEKRTLSHIKFPWSLHLERVVRKAFDEDIELSVNGIPPAAPLMAAVKLRQFSRLNEADLSLVSQIHLSTSRSYEFKITKTHGCKCVPSIHLDGHGLSSILKCLAR